MSSRWLGLLVVAALIAYSPPAHAQRWERWATGLTGGVYPAIAVAPAPARDIYYSFLQPSTGAGRVWRARVDAAVPSFSLMPTFPLATPPAGMTPPNVNTMTTNRRGEPVVGLSTNRSDNVDPLLFSWDEAAGRWVASTIRPATAVCAHSIYQVERAPNGDLWAICQWHGAYRSTDDGRSFDYVDVDALVRSSLPSYFPTRAGGLDTLGALYSIAFDAAGAVIIGTETGGLVVSSDRGTTFRPLDADPTNPTSTMARVTNVGNVYGTGVLADGRVVFFGTPGLAAYPPADAAHLYVADRSARSVTVARGVPDYWVGGGGQLITLPTGEAFLHSNHDTIDTTTGAPVFGGILRTTNGVDWTTFNTGIDEVAMIPGMSTWVDANGRGAAGALAVDGSTLYTATRFGNIYRYIPGSIAPPDAGVGVDAGPSATDAGPTTADAGPTTTDAGPTAFDAGPTTSDAGPTTTDAGSAETDAGAAATDAGSAETDAGAATTDAGSADTDAGAAWTDAGATWTDAGSTESDAGPVLSDVGLAGLDAGAAQDGGPWGGDTGPIDAASAPPDAGAPAAAAGCSCRAGGARRGPRSLLPIALAFGLLLARRGRR